MKPLASFSEINENHDWKWLGLDFSNAKLIGSEGFTDPQKIRDRHFNEWNNLILKESQKYNLEKAFRANFILAQDYAFYDSNMQPKINSLVINKSHELDEDDIRAIVNNYTINDNAEIALAFIIESFDKRTVQATIWVTVIDAKTNKIILTERMTGKPRGFGFKNYWAGAIHDIIKQITKTKYKEWEWRYL